MTTSLRMRQLGPADEAALRAFWAPEPQAHLFAIPDLDTMGWTDARLNYTGWFDGNRLVAYLMLYGISAQWSYVDERAVPDIARLITERRPLFMTGMECTAWPVLNLLPKGSVGRHEPSTVAVLPRERFNPATLYDSPGQARLATPRDLDRLTEVHVAAPDQFNNLDFAARRRALSSAVHDPARRVFLVETPEGRIAASAQTSAEGRDMAVIGGVVTHPNLRGRGYGTLATAHLSASLLEDGVIPYLFYRRDNAPAARVYQKIGYVPLGDSLLAELEWRR